MKSKECYDDGIDCLTRWALQDSVAGAEPSPQVWERIQQSIADNGVTVSKDAPAWYEALLRFLSARWLIGGGEAGSVPGDPRLASHRDTGTVWQERVRAFDMSASLLVMRTIEGNMPFLRLVA
jgi:hypothetical protein